MHPNYLALGNSELERRGAYQQYVNEQEDQVQAALISRSMNAGRPTANDEFCAKLEALLGRQVMPKPRGRPAKM